MTKLDFELQAAKDDFECVSAGTVTINDNLLVTCQVFCLMLVLWHQIKMRSSTVKTLDLDPVRPVRLKFTS